MKKRFVDDEADLSGSASSDEYDEDYDIHMDGFIEDTSISVCS
jgi:hypothetical protein